MAECVSFFPQYVGMSSGVQGFEVSISELVSQSQQCVTDGSWFDDTSSDEITQRDECLFLRRQYTVYRFATIDEVELALV